jgi:hypothetical protein
MNEPSEALSIHSKDARARVRGRDCHSLDLLIVGCVTRALRNHFKILSAELASKISEVAQHLKNISFCEVCFVEICDSFAVAPPNISE